MKKNLLLISALFMSVIASAQVALYKTDSDKLATWTGTDNLAGYSINCLKAGKTIDPAVTFTYENVEYAKPFKFSNGAQHEVILPEGVVVTGVKFVGYTNDNSGTLAFIKELDNNSELGAEDKTFIDGKSLMVDGAFPADFVPSAAEFTLPDVTGKFTFTNGGKQLCAIIILTLKATGIEGVQTVAVTPEAYFNIAGQKVAEPTTGVNIVKMSDGSVRKIIVK